MAAITIKDIARLSGVGVSTVSRVINNSGYVSDVVRDKVNKVIRENNFTPNSSARNLKGGSSKNIALLVKGITNPFFNKMIRIIEEKCALRGYPVLIQNIDSRSNELEIAIRERKDRNLCGVILMGGNFGYSEEAFRKLEIPAVLVTVSASDDISKDLYSSVMIDDEKARNEFLSRFDNSTVLGGFDLSRTNDLTSFTTLLFFLSLIVLLAQALKFLGVHHTLHNLRNLHRKSTRGSPCSTRSS